MQGSSAPGHSLQLPTVHSPEQIRQLQGWGGEETGQKQGVMGREAVGGKG